MLASTREISAYLCPADPWLGTHYNNPVFTQTGASGNSDSSATLDTGIGGPTDFGKLDYFATVYTDIDGDPASATYGAEQGLQIDKRRGIHHHLEPRGRGFVGPGNVSFLYNRRHQQHHIDN